MEAYTVEIHIERSYPDPEKQILHSPSPLRFIPSNLLMWVSDIQ